MTDARMDMRKYTDDLAANLRREDVDDHTMWKWRSAAADTLECHMDEIDRLRANAVMLTATVKFYADGRDRQEAREAAVQQVPEEVY